MTNIKHSRQPWKFFLKLFCFLGGEETRVFGGGIFFGHKGLVFFLKICTFSNIFLVVEKAFRKLWTKQNKHHKLATRNLVVDFFELVLFLGTLVSIAPGHVGINLFSNYSGRNFLYQKKHPLFVSSHWKKKILGGNKQTGFVCVLFWHLTFIKDRI